MNDWQKARISRFKNVRDSQNPEWITVQDFLSGIGSGTCKEQILEIRKLQTRLDAEFWAGEEERVVELRQKIKNQKKRLRAVTPSGTFSARRNDCLIQHSELLCLDFDDLGENLKEAKKVIYGDRHTAACFDSPSGTGLKVFVLITGDHLSAFKAAEANYAQLGYTVDPACKDVVRLCYESFDPDLFISKGTPEPFFGECSVSLPLPPPLPLLSDPSSTPLSSPKTISTPTTTSTVQQEGEGEQIVQRIAARKRIEANPDLSGFLPLYDNLVAPRISVEKQKRNESLTAVVPFLHNAVCKDVAERLCYIMLELNRGVYNGTIEEQMTSLKSLWAGCEREYPGRLSSSERSVYVTLPEKDMEAFRLFRDLAMRSKPDLVFFLSYDHAQLRLGTNGHRTLHRFVGYGLLEVVKRGQQRKAGQRGETGTYRWVLPIPEQKTQPQAA